MIKIGLFFIILILGVGGSALLYAVTPAPYRSKGDLGALTIHPEISDGVAIVIEAVLSYQYILVCISSVDPIRKMTGFQAPLAIGLSIGIGLLMGVRIFQIFYFNFLFSFLFCPQPPGSKPIYRSMAQKNGGNTFF